MKGEVCLPAFNFWWNAVETVTVAEPDPEIQKKPAIGKVMPSTSRGI